jgi:NTE family protein
LSHQFVALRATRSTHVGLGALNPFASISDEVQAAYRKHLFGDATLQDLPDAPRFVINATNVQSGALFRFSKPYMGDYRIGRVMNPTLSLATSRARTTSPHRIRSPLQISPILRFRSRMVLSDGGVYDSLGLEDLKPYRVLFSSHRTGA